jgi:hypothetical protein
VKTIYADFNARTKDDRVWLTTAGSLRSLAEASAGPGTRAWFSDGEVRVLGEIEESADGLVARLDWDTQEDVDPVDAGTRSGQRGSSKGR